ncbi:mannosyl-oligosaccharide glucosidase [Physcia stellaris]|nr:mannosyl-oligosaccharide glucosidase [Physcia stellaris]
MLQQRVRPRKDTSDEEALSGTEAPSTASGTEGVPEVDPSEKDFVGPEGRSSHRESSPESTASSSPALDDPSTLSFGALARAQETLGKRKRPTSEPSPPAKRTHPSHKDQRPSSQSSKPSLPARASKHAPTALSSKHAVSRRREVVDVPKVVARDPRFDPLTGPLDVNRVAQTYSFLSDYQSSEISQLKTEIRNSKDPTTREKLQKALKRKESRQKAEALKEEKQRVVREHRKEEKERVKQGKQPFYLKRADQKKKVLEKRFESMGEKKVNKVIEKRRKKLAGKEKKMLPERRMGRERDGG